MFDKKIINVNDEITHFIYECLEDLVDSTCSFFDYLLLPREGYLAVNYENVKNQRISDPKIGSTMVNYVRKNILNIEYLNQPTFYIYTNPIIDYYLKEEQIDILNVNNKHNMMFVKKLSPKTKEILNSIYKSSDSQDYEIINENVPFVISDYIIWLANQIIPLDENGEPDLNDMETIRVNMEFYRTLEGSNTREPKDYNFYENQQNIIVQTFIWLLCGLNDWLEKDRISLSDVEYMAKILLPDNKDKFTQSVNISKEEKYTIEKNIKFAVFTNNFFISESALEALINLFYNINEEFYRNPDSSHLDLNRVKRLSVLI